MCNICNMIGYIIIACAGIVMYSVLNPQYEERVQHETWENSAKQRMPITTPGPRKQTELEPPGLDVIKNALHSVRVSKRDADEMQRSFEGELFDKWEESHKVAQTKEIPVEKIQQFLDHMERAVEGFSRQVRLEAESILFGTSWSQKIFEFRYKKEDSKSEPIVIFGMVVFTKSADGKTFDCTYAMYKMSFRLSPRVIITEKKHKYLLGLLTWTTEERETVERQFGTKTIKMVQNYFRYKALQTFYNEGIIDKINKVNSLEEIEG